MLRVKTYIDVSSIHGIGLFADEFINKGTPTWQYDHGLDYLISKETIDSLTEIQKKVFIHYCYFDYDQDMYVMPIDDLRFINHTKDKSQINIESTPNQDIAARDIDKGEELLCDYNLFDDQYFDRIGIAPDQLK